MNEEQARELSGWIVQDAANTREFIRASLFHRCLHEVLLRSDEGAFLQGPPEAGGAGTDSFYDRQIWNLLLKEEETAPEVEIEIPPAHETSKERVPRAVRPPAAQKINKTALFTAILSAAAMITLIIYVMMTPPTARLEVATLTDTLHAHWAQPASDIRDNMRLVTNHRPLMLQKGYAELVFDSQATLIIEAPAEFQVLSYDQIKLSYGRLYAKVPQEALGFIVSTPNSKIIDLGTEFGVRADINGTTELHVITGKTSLVSGIDDQKTNILVPAGAARRVSSASSRAEEVAFDGSLFVRQIDSKAELVWRGQNLSLADLVGGGDGFGGGLLNRGIDVLTGNVVDRLSVPDVRSGLEGYVPVRDNPCVDGVFIPGIGWNMTPLTSTGLQTDEFPRTSGMFWGYILNGAWHHGFDVPRHPLELDGTVYDGRRNPAITMHSNLGITFDLEALRKKLPQVSIESFTSLYGVSRTAETYLAGRDFGGLGQSPEVVKLSQKRHSTVEFWVFLDGKKVFRQAASSDSGAGRMEIPIGRNVRFLTLAVTEADDTCMFDWALLTRPELILKAANNP